MVAGAPRRNVLLALVYLFLALLASGPVVR
jgi:hypothetical protein